MTQEQTNNPLLGRVRFPGETFTLPSRGLFYEGTDVYDATNTNAELHVHPMTAIDEIIFKTPDKLFSGDAVREVFSRCIPQITNVDAMLAKDVDYLVMCLRKVSYGENIELEFKHNCDDAKSHSYIVDITKIMKQTRSISPDALSTYSITLDNDQIVHTKPIDFKTFVSILQMADVEFKDDTTVETLQDMLVDSLLGGIKAVDEITDKKFIDEWLRQLKPSMINAIRRRIENDDDWGLSYDTDISCKDCGNNVKTTIPINPMVFFT